MDNCKKFQQTPCKRKFMPTEILCVELIMFFQPERSIKQNKNRKGQIQDIYGAEMPRPIITYLPETSWITSEVSRKRSLFY